MKDSYIPKTTSVKGRTLKDLTANFSLLGVCLRKQLSKMILHRGGAWASLAFKFVDFDKDCGEFGDPRVMLASFKSDGAFYTRQNYFIIKDKEVAEHIVQLLKDWFDL